MMAESLAHKPDAEHGILRVRQQPLDVFFSPRTVAVIGATETPGSVGRTVLWNLISNQFGGTVFPVNLKRSSVLGIKAYPNIAAVPEAVDLAVIVTPAAMVPDLIAECAEAGVKGAIIISAGFKEIGPAGAELERRVLENARRGSMRIIGPNCLGVMSPLSGLNATFAAGFARKGNVGFLSQSGALMTAILDWSLEAHVGFSAFLSLGSMLDVSWGDLIDYLGDDPQTQSIVIYMESIGDARSFLSAAREVALRKPVIVIKAGRTEAAAKAAASHTGSLTGSDEVLEAAFRRSGVLRVNSIVDLFSMAEVLSKQPRPRGPRLTVVSNAGGPGVLATDALVAEGGTLTQLAPQTVAALERLPTAAMEPQQSDRHPRRCRRRPLRQNPGNCRRRSGQRWHAGDLDAAIDDRPHGNGRAVGTICPYDRQAAFGKLDGRGVRRGGRKNPQRGKHSDFPLPGYRGPRLQLYVAL